MSTTEVREILLKSNKSATLATTPCLSLNTKRKKPLNNRKPMKLKPMSNTLNSSLKLKRILETTAE
jgi:hypothetical protein